jgi:hypothetical protein
VFLQALSSDFYRRPGEKGCEVKKRAVLSSVSGDEKSLFRPSQMT